MAVLYGLMAVTGSWTPKLGLDLQGGTSVILTPRSVTGGSVDDGALNKAVDIIRERVDGLGVAEAEVRRAGETIEISVPGRGRNDVVDLVGQTAELRFREVYQAAEATATATAPEEEATDPAATVDPAATGEATTDDPAATDDPVGSPTSAPTGSGGASSEPAAAGTPGRSGSGLSVVPASAAADNGSGPAIQPVASTDLTSASTPTSAPTATAAPDSTGQGTGDSGGDSGDAAGSADTPPADVVTRFGELTCASTELRAAEGSLDRPEDWITACDRTGAVKYLLKPASVVGTDVSSASAGLLNSGGTTNVTTGQWVVSVDFTGEGQRKFTALTEQTVGRQVAIVLDGVVQSAPQINERIASSAQISGSFTQAEAEDLADVLRFGALPLAFERSQAESISPTLGRESLNAGLLAGAIGLGLVVLYSFLYYRALGVVVVTSLLVSGLLIYASVVLLGEAIGFTLTLAGIAGLIVAIGVTADSFVVYFERIKDEVRSGRTVRASVDRAWPSARRTMLSADTVSFMAAVVLYILSVGSVRGFAFTLGLSTLIDVLIMFIFTRPLVTALVRRPFFVTSRFSGLTAEAVGRTRSAAARPRLARRADPAVPQGAAGSDVEGDLVDDLHAAGGRPGRSGPGPAGRGTGRTTAGRRGTAGQRRER